MTHRTGIRVEGRWWWDHTVVQGHIGVFNKESTYRALVYDLRIPGVLSVGVFKVPMAMWEQAALDAVEL